MYWLYWSIYDPDFGHMSDLVDFNDVDNLKTKIKELKNEYGGNVDLIIEVFKGEEIDVDEFLGQK